jgi:hypothetical protein
MVGACYVETHDEAYSRHFALRLIDLSPTHLAFDLVREINNRIEVSFALNAWQFEEVRRWAEIIFGLREPELDGNDDAL